MLRALNVNVPCPVMPISPGPWRKQPPRLLRLSMPESSCASLYGVDDVALYSEPSALVRNSSSACRQYQMKFDMPWNIYVTRPSHNERANRYSLCNRRPGQSSSLELPLFHRPTFSDSQPAPLTRENEGTERSGVHDEKSPSSEPWGTPQEDVYQDDRSVSHLTQKKRHLTWTSREQSHGYQTRMRDGWSSCHGQ